MTTEEEIAKLEHKKLELANDRERLIYWLCRAHRHEGMTNFRRDLGAVLAEFGYDEARIRQMCELGEPTARPVENVTPLRVMGTDRREVADVTALLKMRERIILLLDAVDEAVESIPNP